MPTLAARDRLIVALDMPTLDAARALVERLGDQVTFYKVGLELLFGGGLAFAQDLRAQNKNVFLDMKLLDIGNTVERAVANAAEAGRYLPDSAWHGFQDHARGRCRTGANPLKLLAVTVLTSLDANDLVEQGTTLLPEELVLRRARMAEEAGFDGVIASGQEAAKVRAETSSDFLIVTPGIRLSGGASDDQARITTPDSAIEAGANYLVVGRPITQAEDPVRWRLRLNAR